LPRLGGAGATFSGLILGLSGAICDELLLGMELSDVA